MFQSNNGHNSEANTQKHVGMDVPKVKGKGKAGSLQAWTDPEGS